MIKRLSEGKLSRVVLADQVYERLKERVLDQALKPGERLNIDALVRELEVSSTPIREALGRLAAEGLVEARAFAGFIVASLPDRAFYVDLYAFRLVLEPWAAAEAARRRPPDALARMNEAVRRMGAGSLSRRYRANRAFNEADGVFHQAVVFAAGNAVVRKTYEDLRIHLHVSRLFVGFEQDAALVRDEHAAVLEAIESGAARSAAGAMRTHLTASRRRLSL